jgi:pimeloyl-ACP methyl ester carboxylesterase
LTAAEDLTISHDGYTTRFLQAGPSSDGAAPVVLLVHDGWFGADAQTLWSRVIPELARRHRVIAPDMLGFGGTTKAVYFDRSMYQYRAEHLGSFVRAVVGDDVSVHGVGVSMGGSILLREAAASEHHIALASALSIAGTGGPWRTPFGADELGRYDGSADDIVRVLHHMAEDFPGWDDVIARRQENTERRGHVQSLLAGTVKVPRPSTPPASDNWPVALASTNVPVTVVECLQDLLVEHRWAEHFKNLGEHVVTRTMDTKHAPPLDHPQEVAALILSHLEHAHTATREGALR